VSPQREPSPRLNQHDLKSEVGDELVRVIRKDPPNDSPSADAVDKGFARSPLEAHGSYRGEDWSPQRLMFHHNLESFAERVGLIVALQSNGKLSQEKAYAEIRKIWKELKESKDSLINGSSPPPQAG
jgi:hypothetical protein